MGKALIKFEDGKIVAGIDSNEDGQNSITFKLSVGEAVQEGLAALKKGEEKSVALEVKKVKLLFIDGKIKITVDTDQDGDALLEVEVDLAESFDEVTSLVFKD